jgi:acetolactate synthase-1/3 small subunit
VRQAIEVELENTPGALMRVAGILTATGANIERLTVRPLAAGDGISILTLIAEIEPRLRVRVVQQMNRLINVLRAEDVTEKRIQPGKEARGYTDEL